MENNENNPLSIWQFLGLQVLSMIPCIGFICLIVFACGAIKNTNVKNWARAMLLLIAIIFVIYMLLIMLGVGTAMLAGTNGILTKTY